jgi:hypothetical protein
MCSFTVLTISRIILEYFLFLGWYFVIDNSGDGNVIF